VAVSYSEDTIDQLTLFDFDGGSSDLSGNRIAGSPDWLASLQLGWGLGPVDGLLTLRHVGRFYLDNTENARKQPELRDDPAFVDRINDAHTVVDLAAAIDLGPRLAEMIQARQVRLDLRVNNLTDELYTTFGYMDWTEPVWIPAATRSVYTGITVDW
jgi:outer membrane receptor protein involved in Fe transport